jgi:sugar/nucleoside kinase (ribokinase family)
VLVEPARARRRQDRAAEQTLSARLRHPGRRWSSGLDGEVARAQPPQTHEVSATGAGDAFAAAVFVSLAPGLPFQEAIADGCRGGALAASSPDGWPTMRESREAEDRREENP